MIAHKTNHTPTHDRRCRRALTIVELLLALSVTSMIGLAIASMMAVVSNGVVTRRDARSVMLRGHAVHARLASTLGSSNCMLDVHPGLLVLWYEDARKGGTVHASEVRWYEFDPQRNVIEQCRVAFPESWTQTEKDAADKEFTRDSDWQAVLNRYETTGFAARRTIADRVSDVNFAILESSPTEAKLLRITMTMMDAEGMESFQSTIAIRFHKEPLF